MKINTLSLTNFRNHRQSTLTLDKLNFFVGHNNAGKTSILAAIEWGLTGKCMWTDKAGRGATDLVQQGAKQAAVALEVEGIGGLVRTMPPHSLQLGKLTGVIEGQAAILNNLRTDEESLRISLNAGTFLSLSQGEQRALLFATYGLNFTADSVVEQLTSWLAEKRYPEDLAKKLVDQARAWYPQKMTGGPEVLDVMEKRAKELRRDLKKDKQRLEAAIEELGPTLPMPGPLPALTEIQDKLKELQQRRDELLKASGGQDGVIRREKLQAMLLTLGEKISSVKAKGAELAAKIKALDQGEDKEKLAEQIRILKARLNSHQNQAATVENRLKTLNEAALALAASDRRCPLAPTVIQCSLSSKQVEKILASINQEQNNAREELDRIASWAKDTTSELAALEKRQQENEALTKQQTLWQGEIKTQRVLYDQLTADKEAVEQEVTALPVSSHEEANQYNLQIAEVNQSIRRAEEQLARAKEAANLAKRLEEMKSDQRLLADEVEQMEILVKALGPEGLRKNILGGILDNFLGRVNERLARLTEGAYQISLAEDMTILCRANGGPLLPLKLLSKSEQLRVGIAISDALSAKAGLNFLAIDEADMLDQENRDLLTGLLLDLAEEYDQVLVCTTVGDVQPQNPGFPGVKMFWVGDGRVQEM
ncbi:AAA family ATPase [Desulforamulus aquiferis]|uniref:Nuclease SbcCD subunit C n=1 Tax=Desulforamulus aquiferis TaxID=1397668 RepID=A0AAW7ZDQ4_9FIRM|nr:AAA family ATPase [Desulforamulus aquiferis]MDO7787894.1 AAA family ATPase [Desulforamulus aquiferis]